MLNTHLISFFALLVSLLAGCARSPLLEAPEPLSEEQLRELKITGSSVKADILYALLTAEIAGQRGQYRLALKNYLQVAEQVPDPWIAERAARIALYLNETDKAMAAVNLWLSHAPDNLDANKAATMLYLQTGDFDQATEQFVRLLNLAGENKEQVMLEILRFMDKRVSKGDSLKVMEALVTRMPESPEAHYGYALLALREGDAELALRHVTQALDLRPDWNKVQLMQSHLLTQLGESDKARQVLKELLDTHPDNPSLRMVYGQFLLKEKDYQAAEKEFKSVLKRHPDHPDALYALALVSLQLNKEQQAERMLKQLLKQPKWRSEAYFYLGRIEARRGHYTRALQWFDRVKEGDLAFDAAVNAVASLAKQGRMELALKRLETLKADYPERRLQIYLLEAEILNDQKDFPGAFSVLTEGLAEFPGNHDLLYARALMAEKLGKLDIVESDLRAILKDDPQNVNALNALGYTLADRTDRLQEARNYLDQAIRLKPEDPAIMDSYGWLLYRLGDYQGALNYLQKAYQLNPDPEIGAHLGEVLWALGRKSEAKQLWREVLQKAGNDERAQQLLKRFKQRLSR